MTHNQEIFGEFIKNLRSKLRISLRSFCLDNGFDAGNYSKMERNILSPPKDPEKLKKIAQALQLQEGTDEWKKFFDLSAIANGNIPDYIMNDRDLLNKLPVFFRTLDGQKIDDEKLIELIDLIKKG